MTALKFKLGSLTIDAQAYGSQGNAILGIRDSGKTYTATEIAEKLFEAGIPFVTFDPTGVWRWLQVPGKGRGYPIVVAGGKEGNLPLTVSGAVEIVRAAMKNGVSLVIDLTDHNLSKADWKRIVKSCVRVLLQENGPHGLRHIFIEEAAEFAPQRVIDGDVYAEVEKLARIGGNSRLGYTLINQRSQEVNKAVLELCENLFLHRQKGKNAIQSLDHWLGAAGVDQGEIVKSLPKLKSGDCWAWMGGEDAPTLIHVPPKNSFHPDRRTMFGAKGKRARKAVDVGSFIKDMKTALVGLEAEHAAKDPTKLQAKVAEQAVTIARLEKAAATAAPAKPDKDAIAAAEQRGFDQAQKKLTMASEREVNKRVLIIMDSLRDLLKPLDKQLQEIVTAASKAPVDLWAPVTFTPPTALPRPAPRETPLSPSRARTLPVQLQAAPTGDGTITPALQKVLDAIAWWRKIGIEPVARARAAVVAGYSPRASTFGVYVAELVKMGKVATGPGVVQLTEEGLAIANSPSAATQDELRDMARGLLAPQEAKVFDVIYDAYPREILRAEIANQVGLSPTASTVGVYIAAVAAYGIVENAGRGAMRAADWLFPMRAAA